MEYVTVHTIGGPSRRVPVVCGFITQDQHAEIDAKIFGPLSPRAAAERELSELIGVPVERLFVIED